MMQEYKTTNPELAILGLVAEKPVHGYELEQIVAQRGMRQWTEIGFSSIYHVLGKLQSNGLLEAETLPAGGRPARRIFHLTSLGLKILQDELFLRLSSPRHNSSDMDLVLANWIILPRPELLGGLRAQRQHLSLRLEQVEAKWRDDRLNPGFPSFANELFDHSCHTLRAEIQWLDAFLQRVQQDPIP